MNKDLYLEKMKEWAECQDYHLISKINRIDSFHSEYEININGVGFAINDFSNFEKDLINIIAKYRI